MSELFSKNASYHERAARFIAASGSLYHDVERTASKCILTEKLMKFTKSLEKRILPVISDKKGTETLRFSSAVTPNGIVSYIKANTETAKKVYVFEDRFGAAAHCFTEHIRNCALMNGYDIVTSRSPMAPFDKIDAIYIPNTDTWFCVSSFFDSFTIDGAIIIRERRFYDAEQLNASKNRLNFSKKAMHQLLSEASQLIAEAKSVHDLIEQVYSVNIDFEKVHERESELVKRLGLK